MRKLRCGELERVIQSRGPPTRGNFNPRGHRAILETFLVIADWGGGSAKHPAVHRTAPSPPTKNFPGTNVKSAKAEKLV